MLEIFYGEKTTYDGSFLNDNGIDAAITKLHEFINEIDNYPDKSLFFQTPLIFNAWIHLIRTVQEIRLRKLPENSELWEECGEIYVNSLLKLRGICNSYKDLTLGYYNPLDKLLKGYGDGGWLFGECLSVDDMEALCEDHYEKDLKDVSDMPQYLLDLNKTSCEARSKTYDTLCQIHDLLIAIINRGSEILYKLKPSDEDFAKALDAVLKARTRTLIEKKFKEMEEELARHYMEDRTDDYTSKVWSKMLDADEDALKMAKKKQLSKCDDPKQEHWGKAIKAKMDENSELMDKILSIIKTKELFDLGKPENVKPLIPLLTKENLTMFIDIVIRRSLIQCEMFPELKAQHDYWLNSASEQQPDENNDTGMDAAQQSKLDEIISILQKGDWKQPATADNIELLLNTVFGKDTSLLEEGDETLCEKMWSLVKNGKGKDRKVIISAKLAGFMGREENLMKNDGPKAISDALFGKNNNQANAINKGKMGCSDDFDAVIPFLKKYIDKIIRQV